MRGLERESRDDAAKALFELTAEIADNELRPAVAAAEREARFPREAFRLLGRAGLLGLPYPEEFGGAGAALRDLPPGPRGACRGMADHRPRLVRARPQLLRADHRRDR